MTAEFPTHRATAAAGQPEAGQLVLVHGLGRFGGGREAIRYLSRRGCRLRIADQSQGADLLAVRDAMHHLPAVDWQLGREDADLLTDIDWLVVNPAVPDHHPLLQAALARGIRCTQEADLFLRNYPGRIVAITGTNGKSSTATLLHAALQRSGLDTLLGGNLGHSLLADEANWRADQIAVLEISSFQLERLAADARVHGAVFTRVQKDHIDRHGSLAAYQAAKGRLAAAATGLVVHAAEDPVASAYLSPARERFVYALTGPAPRSAGLRGGYLAVRLGNGEPELLVHRDALRMLGEFQIENALAAALAARWLGAHPHGIGLGLAQTPPLPFRLQLVGRLRGIAIYDNAVSTEIASTRSALASLPGRLHWVGGGKSKDGDYAAVAAGVLPFVTSAHLFGAAAEPLAQALANSAAAAAKPLPVTRQRTVREALTAALAAARPGDTLLFSPAFASFDQYANFRERARDFHAWLQEQREDHGTAG
jgi:UDP-N-acetylmuramoylalanine--D-glutamate ligase